MTPKDIATVEAALETTEHPMLMSMLYFGEKDAFDAVKIVNKAARAMLAAAPTPPADNGWMDIDWDDICFRIAEKLYGHDENKWSLPYADLNVIRLVQEFIDQQLYERETNPPPPAMDKKGEG